jgi:hypothetical protein
MTELQRGRSRQRTRSGSWAAEDARYDERRSRAREKGIFLAPARDTERRRDARQLGPSVRMVQYYLDVRE